MKYKIFGLDPDKIIRKYVIKNNHIVVIFLAGNKQVIPYTKDNELALINEMTKQALMRENDFFNDVKFTFLVVCPPFSLLDSFQFRLSSALDCTSFFRF